MIAGPGVYWNRGDGPMPDLDTLEKSIRAANRAPAAREGSAYARPNLTTQVRAARVSKRSTPIARSTQIRPATASKRSTTHQCRKATWRTPAACRVEPPAHHNRETTGAPHPERITCAKHPPKKANKRRITFPKPAQTCSPSGWRPECRACHQQQSRAQKSAAKTSGKSGASREKWGQNHHFFLGRDPEHPSSAQMRLLTSLRGRLSLAFRHRVELQ